LRAKHATVGGAVSSAPPATQPPESPAKAATATAAVSDATVEGAPVRASEEHPHPAHGLERLNRTHRYLICDKTKVVAMWENNGQGWYIRTPGGFASATRNRDKLPSYGEFVMVELKLAMTEAGLRLTGLAVLRLANRWALTTLDKGDDRVLSTVAGQGSLSHDQKTAVRQALREHFMRPVWAESQDVLEYLNNTDYHSPGVDTKVEG
jgi:hypothetical protein